MAGDGGETTAGLAALSASEKRALLERLLGERARTLHPLSFAQARIWFMERLSPGTADQHIFQAIRFRAGLRHDAFARAWNDVVRRHEILRTGFEELDGTALQVVHAEAQLTVEQVDLTGLPATARDEALRRHAQALFARPFALARPPLLRVASYAMGADDSVLVVVLHHIAGDNESVNVLYREVRALYEAALLSQPVALPPVGTQYGAFARRQRAALDPSSRDLAYWRETLRGATPLTLPADRPRSGARRAERLSRALDRAATTRLRELARRQRVTPFMLTLAAYQALLARYSGQTDIVVGTPISGRDRAELSGAVGLYLNDLVLRSDLSGDPSFSELLQRVRAVALGAFGRREVPFEKLVEELQPVRDPLRHPFFDLLFLYLQDVTTQLDGVDTVDLGHATAKLDLSHLVIEEPDHFVLIFEYDAGLYDRQTIDGFARALERLLLEVARDPEQRLSAIALAPEPASVPEQVAAGLAARGAAPAVVAGDEVWSGDAVLAHARRVAGALRARAIGAEDVVLVALPRSPRQLASLLGVWWAGAAYLPVDPATPAERIAFIARDGGARVVIADEPLGDLPHLALATLGDALADATPARVSADALAYVIYTSGSTGKPKGVMVSHGGLANLVAWSIAKLGLDGADRGAHLAGLGFDAAVWEVWPLWAAAGALAIPPEAARWDAEALQAWLLASDVTVAFAPTPLGELLLALPWPRSRLRELQLGGDRLTRRPPATLPFAVSNNYGPTETTVVATTALVAATGAGLPTIGAPLPATSAHVLDERLQPVAAGVVGELYLGGAGVARGYLGRPRLTAERFVADPFVPGARLYRSGDLVRRRGDGELEFVGRADGQVKLRGFRIELGEIEAALRDASGCECACALHDGATLVGYVVTPALDCEALRAQLGRTLPDYMVPAALVALPALPLSAHGKIDRAALPKPERAWTAPATPLEATLAAAWQTLLGVPRVGRDDDFFALGGHSLVATQLISRLRAQHLELPLRLLFDRPRLRELAAALAAQTGEQLPLPPLAPRPPGEPAPLSFAQQRFWFLDRLEPGSNAYNIALPVRIRGPLAVDRLQRAIAQVVQQHAQLRTVYRAHGDGACQIAEDGAAASRLEQLDLRGRADAEATAQALLRARAEEPFDLARGPIVRWTLLRLADDEQLLLLAMHHIAVDGWSMGLLIRDLGRAYQGVNDWPAAPIDYGDYAAWQRRRLDGARLEGELAHWRRRLDGAPPLLELPLDRPRPAVQTSRGGVVRLSLDAALTRALRELARAQHATPFMVLLAAFKALLARFSGQHDLVVGTPVAGRTDEAVEPLVGLFVNTLALRTDLSGRPSFLELLARVRDGALDAFAHQEVPFDRLVEELLPPRSLAYSPLVQVLFELQNAPATLLSVAELELTIEPLDTRAAKFNLALIVEEEARTDSLTALFEYRADLFDAATIESLAQSWRALIAGALAEPERPVAELALDRAEPALDRQPADRPAPSPVMPTLPQLFAARVAEQPEAAAVVDEAGTTSYAALAAAARRVAHGLRVRGVQPGELVAVQLPRSAAQLACFLGILEHGAAYLPLDVDYPPERLDFMLADAGARLVVSDTRPGALTMADFAAAATEPAPPPPPLDQLAYVIYTSGSTGKPKGVMVTHRGLANQALWVQRTFALGAADRVVYKASAGFDASLLEQLVPLACGATVAVLPQGRQYDVDFLADFLARERISYMDISPALLAALAGRAPAPVLPSLRAITAGGETLAAPLAQACERHWPGCLYNTYGPTETTIQSTYWDCRAGLGGASVPIGRPIAHTSCHVLDERLQPLPSGAVGELYIGGAGVARGYLGRPALTAERFCADPFDAGARLYRTGDLVRRRGRGELEFVGRADGQVKLRGFRIELGEIEAALREAAGVRDAAAAVRHDWGAGAALVGYVAAAAPLDGEALRAQLARRLPEYMVPATIVVLDALPLTAHGKIDRAALPRPETRALAEWAAPATPIEQALADIWQTLLRAERVGRHDDFFALGGHSLVATQVVSRLRAALGIEVPLRLLFAHPVLSALAAAIAPLAPATTPATAIPHRSDDTPRRLSFAQQRLWFLDRLAPGQAVYNLALPLTLRQPLDAPSLAWAIEQVVTRQTALRTVYVAEAGEPRQRVTAAADASRLEVVDLAHADELAARLAAASEAPFDLARGPLARWTLYRLPGGEQLLLIVVHHIAIDGWSVPILLRELQAAYAAAATRTAPWPPLAIDYGDYAEWQREQLSGERLAAELDHWRRRLAGAPPLLELPTDRPRRAEPAGRGSFVGLTLDAELSGRVRALAHAHGATEFMVLLAGFAALLARYSGGHDLVIGTPVAGRTDEALEPLIGFFVNTLVLRCNLSGRPSFVELLERVKQTALEAWAHQGMPFERLVEELVPQRSSAHSPLVQVAFTFDRAQPSDDGGAFVLEESPLRDAKFDLTLAVDDLGGELRARFHYRTALFDEGTVASLAAAWQRLLAAAVSAPERPVDEAALAVAEPAPAGPALPSAPLLLAAQAAAWPDATAVVERDGSEWSYRRLADAAARVAAALRARGVGRGELVTVTLPRSAARIAAQWGIWQAGAAYLPLEPATAPERRARIERDAAVRTCVDEATFAHAQTLAPAPAAAPPAAAELAYVIYTSGSTGAPKGVMVTHGGLANLVDWTIGRLGLGPTDRGAHLAGLAFDAAAWELWPYLGAGAAVAIPDEEARWDAPRLQRWLVARQVTATFVPTPLGELLLALPWPASRLRELMLGGDRLSRRPPPSLPFAVSNNYGPTETTVVATAGRTGADGAHAPAIGRALPHTVCHVLDARLQPLPDGALGELYIGGAGVARGYLGQPRSTAERFVADPFGSGGRLYRSGDLVRRRADGELEFVGRADGQVKLRGFRIELGEIEAALRDVAGVRDAVVLLRDDWGAGAALVAYVVAAAEPVDEEALRAQLRRRLPEYMVPAALVTLPALPLTAHGKIDRRALPKPDARALAPWAAPATPLEETLAAIWRAVIGAARIGRDDDFFALGGHSLVATQVVARLRSAVGVEVPLRLVFDHPVLRDQAAAIAALTATADDAPPLMALPPGTPRRLSFAQQRLWFLDRLQPGNSAYNIALPVRIHAPVDSERLERAIAAVVARQQALRTVYVADGAGARQEVGDGADASRLEQLDLRGQADGDAALAELVRTRGAAPFDLERGPLVRWTLVRLAGDEQLLLIVVHHIAVDGWSMNVLLRELVDAYQGRADWPPLAVEYGDYAEWQRRWLDGERLQRELDHWRQRLAGAPPLLELPLDHARPALQGFAGARVPVALDAALTQAVRERARAEQATPFMVLLASFAALLSRYGGQRDLVVGTPVAGRTEEALEPLVGFFVNTLALRLDLSGRPSFRELVERVRASALDGFAHQRLPFERLVEELAPQRSLAYAPLVQAMFTLERAATDALGDGSFTLDPAGDVVAKFDLTLGLQERGDALVGAFEYRTELFRPETVARLAAAWQRLLAAALAEPARPVDDLELAEAPPEPATPAAPFVAAPLRLQQQLARDPDAVAVIDVDGSRWSYRRLDETAGAVAAWLHARGVGRGDIVLVALPRSPLQLAALWAAWKLGAAYLPADPSLPAERLDAIAADAGVRVRLDAGFAPPPAPLDWSAPPPLADELAYVIYTSGSTGRPKGVMVSHGALANLIAWSIDERQLTRADRGAYVAGLGFDAALLELWPLLAVGASLAIPDEDVRRDGARLRDWLLAAEVTVSFVPTPLAEPLLTMAWPPSRLRELMVGGDRLSRRPPPSLPFAISNNYGPTETTVVAAAAWVAPGAGAPTIGRALPGLSCHVLDERLRPLPLGAVGELYIGGAAVARGYLGRPDLTAERFVADPFVPGARLYRTGDLGRRRDDGELECLGRRDGQVKLRGYRIELGELEAALRQCPGVHDAAALLRDDLGAGAALVAYVVPAADADRDLTQLRGELSRRLPGYMVPAAVVAVPALPLTPNGKLDRAALPRPTLPSRSGEPPRPGLEQRLAELWQSLLQVEAIGRDDDFFALGGHSLVAVQAVQALRATLGVELPLAAFFRAPTLAAMAEELAAAPPATGAPRLQPIRPGRGRRAWVFVHPIGGAGLVYGHVIAALAGDAAVYLLQAPEAAELAGLETLAELGAQHAARLRAHDPTVDWLPVGWSFGGVLALELARALGPTTPALLIDSWLADAGLPALLASPAALLRLYLDELRGQTPAASPTAALAARLAAALADAGTDDDGAAAAAVAAAWSAVERDRQQWTLADVTALRRGLALFSQQLRLFAHHAPAPHAGPVALVHAAQSGVDPRWPPLAPQLTTLSLDGDHHSLLRPPLAARVADALAQVNARLQELSS